MEERAFSCRQKLTNGRCKYIAQLSTRATAEPLIFVIDSHVVHIWFCTVPLNTMAPFPSSLTLPFFGSARCYVSLSFWISKSSLSRYAYVLMEIMNTTWFGGCWYGEVYFIQSHPTCATLNRTNRFVGNGSICKAALTKALKKYLACNDSNSAPEVVIKFGGTLSPLTLASDHLKVDQADLD